MVLVAAGHGTLTRGPNFAHFGALNTAELYEPTGTFFVIHSLNSARRGHDWQHFCPTARYWSLGAAYSNSAELYNPATRTWSTTANLNTDRSNHTATLLPDGKVLVAGGLLRDNRWHTPTVGNFPSTPLAVPPSTGELYDAVTATWGVSASLNTARSGHTATLLPNGKVLVAGGSSGNDFLSSAELFDLHLASSVDFDGDGKSDIGVYRNGAWFILRSSDGRVTTTGWGGLPQDKPLPADYDGDGKFDIAVYRDGMWFILRSSDGGVTTIGWGGLTQDKALPADYDGDGKADIAVYRDGTWFILRSSDGGQTTVGWGGVSVDVPVPADYDGDGKADIAVYRDGTWFILRSSDGGVTTVGWGGVLADVPVPADYDGDGKADIAVYRGGTWFILRSLDGGPTTVGWGGLPEDVPVPADFDGDGKADIAVYRDGTWFIIRSSDGMQTSVGWGGAPEDIPLN